MARLNKGTAGVGVFIAEIWIDSGVDVVRVNEQIMYVKLVIGTQIGNIVSAYVPPVGLSAEEKDDFWDSFIIVISGIPKQDIIFISSEMNGHVGRDADGYSSMVFGKYTQLCRQSKFQEFTVDLRSEYGRKNCFKIAREGYMTSVCAV